jgi:hypothetical protein
MRIIEVELTDKQKELKVKHGTPEQFEAAVWRALGEISVKEAIDGIHKYEREWAEAGNGK